MHFGAQSENDFVIFPKEQTPFAVFILLHIYSHFANKIPAVSGGE